MHQNLWTWEIPYPGYQAPVCTKPKLVLLSRTTSKTIAKKEREKNFKELIQVIPTWESMGVSLKQNHSVLDHNQWPGKCTGQTCPLGFLDFPLLISVQKGANVHSGDTAPLSQAPCYLHYSCKLMPSSLSRKERSPCPTLPRNNSQTPAPSTHRLPIATLERPPPPSPLTLQRRAVALTIWAGSLPPSG